MMTRLWNGPEFLRRAGLSGLACLCLLAAAGPQKLFSQTEPVTYRTPNRWLIIVETSRAMQPRAEAVAQIAGNLLLSEMNGQLRPGDTLGLWTFNSDLHAGEFPLQTWSPENSKTITARVAAFLARQKFENRASRDRVFPVMNTVISNSEFITVFLISAGGETFTGTPFDKAINAIHRKWQSQQEKARLPFVTILRAQNGRSTDFEVNLPPAPLELPPLPPELLVTNPIIPKPAPPKPIVLPPPIIGSNIIIHGKKLAPPPEVVSNPPPVMVSPTHAPPSAEFKTNPPAPMVSLTTNALPAVTTEPAVSPAAVAATNARAPLPPEPPAQGNFFWVAGLIAAIAAAGLVWVLARRARSQTRVSLITRSLDREKKN